MEKDDNLRYEFNMIRLIKNHLKMCYAYYQIGPKKFASEYAKSDFHLAILELLGFTNEQIEQGIEQWYFELLDDILTSPKLVSAENIESTALEVYYRMKAKRHGD
jgi:hypothetical protein